MAKKSKGSKGRAEALAQRQQMPDVISLMQAHPDMEWEGDSPIWGWTRGMILQAAMAHDSGSFGDSERLYEAMTRIGRIGAGLRRRAEGLRRFPFCLLYKDGTPERIRYFGEALEEMWDERVLSEVSRSEVIQRVIMFGFCVARIHKPLVDEQRVPELEVWTHRTLQWDSAAKGWRGRDDKGCEVFIPRKGDDEWVVFSLGGKRPWLKGAIRELARVFAQILQTEDLWDSNNEALGFAMKVLGVPNQIREHTEVERAWRVVRKLRSGDVWLKPDGYSLDLLESKRGDVHNNFKERLAILAATISIILLGHNLTQETKGGSLAATSAAMELPREASVTDARVLEVGYRQLSRLWMSMNFAPAHYDTPRPLLWYAPRPVFRTKEPKDKAQLADTGQKNAAGFKNYIESAKAAGVDIKTIGIDWRAQAVRCNVALLDFDPSDMGSEGKSSRAGERVKYMAPEQLQPAPPAAPSPPSRSVQRMSAREPEAEEERLAEDFEAVRPMWTV